MSVARVIFEVVFWTLFIIGLFVLFSTPIGAAFGFLMLLLFFPLILLPLLFLPLMVITEPCKKCKCEE